MRTTTLHRIYADFNALNERTLALEGVGTLRALSNAGCRLVEGMRLVFWDDSSKDDDLEAEGTVDWVGGEWVAHLEAIHEVPKAAESVRMHLCPGCRRNLMHDKGYDPYPRDQTCSSCGVRLWQPFDPPEVTSPR